MKAHVFRELVNKLRDIAVQYHGHQSLRDRIARAMLEADPELVLDRPGKSVEDAHNLERR